MKILKTMTNKASSAKTKRFHDFIFILVMYKMLKQPLNDNDIPNTPSIWKFLQIPTIMGPLKVLALSLQNKQPSLS